MQITNGDTYYLMLGADFTDASGQQTLTNTNVTTSGSKPF